MSNKFTKGAQSVLKKSLYFAMELGHSYIGSEHLLMALSSDRNSAAGNILSNAGVDFEQIKRLVVEISGQGATSSVTPNEMTPRTRHIIENSSYLAVRLEQTYIGTEMLLLAILEESDCVAVKILSDLGKNPKEIAAEIINYLGKSGEDRGAEEMLRGSIKRKAAEHHSADKGELKNCPTLSQYGKELTLLARQGKLDPIIGRNEEMDRVIQILSRRTKNNPCLIGEPGVGKTAVVEGLAQRIVEGNIPETLADKIIVTLDLSGMIAGAKYRGEFEERLKGVMTELQQNKRIIIFIDEIHTIVGAGAAEGAVDAANIIKPALSRGEMQMIGATTIDEYRKHIEKDAALERRFQPVNVGEPAEHEAIAILKGLRPKYEAHHNLKITDEAIEAAVKLSSRYIADRYLPDKAIDLIDEAAAKLRIGSVTPPPELKAMEDIYNDLLSQKEEAIKNQDFEKAAELRDKERKAKEEYDSKKQEWDSVKSGTGVSVGEDEITDIVSGWTGIPVKKLAEEESERLKNLDKILHNRIIGQDAAVDAVARAIRRGRLGLKDPGRPMGSFIFLGPTGVGKTELTKALAEVLFGDENSMIRIDMSEYMEKHSVSKLIGSPPGYVGHEEGGQLTEKVRRKPYSVVLFDEIEKAHPDVFNILLQILDDGVLSDSQGRRVDFKNTIIIMTSNVGASGITEKAKTLGFGDHANNEENEANSRVMEALKATFRPEFLNRLDEIIIFKKLTENEIQLITKLMLNSLAKRVSGIGVSLKFDASAVELISANGFDPVYGARPIRREIQKTVEDEFSNEMLNGNIQSGDKVLVTCDNNKIVFKKAEDDNIGDWVNDI